MRSLFPALQHRTLLLVLLGALAVSAITVFAVTVRRGEAEEPAEPEPTGPPVFVTGGTPAQ